MRNLMKLKEGMGDKLGVIANLVGTSVLCICQSLSAGWQLTLACITVIPFAVAASVILSNVSIHSWRLIAAPFTFTHLLSNTTHKDPAASHENTVVQ